MNKASIAVLLIASTILIAALSGQTKQPAISSQPSRYQLFAAEYTLLGPASNEKVILRIDTQTGNVDQWTFGKREDGRYVDTWVRIGEEPLRRPN